MTCVAAIAERERIYMAADSAGVAGLSLHLRRDPKIYRVGSQMLIGFTSSFRMGQLLGYSLTLPEHRDNTPVERYMTTAFIDAVRTCLKNGGWAKKEHEVESGGQFLVGYRGRLFEVDSDFQVGESLQNYAAVGSGFEIALGSLHSTKAMTARKRLSLALDSAERFSAGVRRPFRFETL